MLTFQGIVQKRKSPDFRFPEVSISAYYLFFFLFLSLLVINSLLNKRATATPNFSQKTKSYETSLSLYPHFHLGVFCFSAFCKIEFTNVSRIVTSITIAANACGSCNHGNSSYVTMNFVSLSRVSIKESSVAKLGSVCRRVYRIFSHAYFHHRSIYDEFEVSFCNEIQIKF